MKKAIELLRQDLVEYVWHLDLNKKKKDCKNLTINDYFKVLTKFPVFKFVQCLRICNGLARHKYLVFFYYIERLRFRRLQNKYGIQTGYRLSPGGGFFIGHYGGIVIHQETHIGKNFTIHQNTTIGTNDRGVPYIGDNVSCGANVCIIGDVSIGNGCKIGAGAVVVKSFDENKLIVGNPAVSKNIQLQDEERCV